MTIVWISVFGAMGVLTRYGVGIASARWVDSGWPWATFSINVVGSFLIGAVYVAGVERSVLSEPLRLAVMVGFLGGFTTFSSFSLETARLLEMNRIGLAFAYVAASALLGLGATFGGMALCRRLLGAS